MRVLVIEDESSIRDNIIEMFELKEIEVYGAINGKEALASIDTILPNIILCDLMMPVMNGFEFIEVLKLRDQHKNIPVIFVSARAEISEKEKALEAGAVDFITKPFSFVEVFEKLKKHYKQS